MIDNTSVKKNHQHLHAAAADNDCLMYRPFQSSLDKHNIKRDHYSTSLDPRGYIPVYEYIINNTPIMWDRETGYVHFTGIWKALGNSKSDIVKLVDSNPELGTKKIRGGFLRIQGTWIPYDYAHILCKRTAWNIRKELVPIFGQGFLNEALSPEHPDYGCLLLDPKNLPVNRRQSKESILKKRNTTMRQQQQNKPNNNKIVKKTSQYLIKKKLKQQEIMRQQKKIAESMSVNRLLNEEEEQELSELSSEEELFDTDDDDDNQSDMMTDDTTISSGDSPTFRVIQTYPNTVQDNIPLLPPIHTSFSPRIVSNYEGGIIAQDIIDTISATILLQRLSQDDGARPFKPLESSAGIPSKVIVGHQEFTICWD